MPEFYDNIKNPEHYCVYPVQPIEISHHLNFCLGNAVKYVLRAPYKGGVEDCDKAVQYLHFENRAPQKALSHFQYLDTCCAIRRLISFFHNSCGDILWQDISSWQSGFLEALKDYLFEYKEFGVRLSNPGGLEQLRDCVRELRRVLQLRDTIGQIYEGMTGLPINQEDS